MSTNPLPASANAAEEPEVIVYGYSWLFDMVFTKQQADLFIYARTAQIRRLIATKPDLAEQA